MELTIKTELIANYIKQNKLTIKEFCKRCKISQETYYRIMNGCTNIRSSTLYRILVETDILCDDLVVYK